MTNKTRLMAVLMTVALASGCGGKTIEKTGLVVEVRAIALQAGVDIDEVVATVDAQKSVKFLVSSTPVSPEVGFPFVFGVVPTKTSSDPVVIEVTARLNGADVLKVGARVTFVKNEVKLLVLTLEPTCVGKERRCGDWQACDLGAACTPVMIDAATLPKFEPPKVDAGTGGHQDAGLDRASADTDTAGDVAAPPADGGGDTAGDGGGLCVMGETRCAQSGQTVEACDGDGVWMKRMDCPAVCRAGACAGSCKPNEKHCGLNQTPETCSAAGEWVAEARCAFACSGAGVCGGQCVPGVKRCSGPGNLAPELCDDSGTWKANGAACANLCSSGSCAGSCMPTAKQCGSNQIPETCSGQGTWEPGTRCPFVCTGAGNCTGECEPNARTCGSSNRPRVCGTDGMWRDEGPCPFVCTGSGACTGQCVPGAMDCLGVAGGTLRICDAGTWRTSRVCPYICSGNACGGECRPGDRDCSGRIPRSCNPSGVWVNETICQFACRGAGSCTACDPGVTRACTGNILQLCKADGSGFQTDTTCTNGCNTTRLECNACMPDAMACELGTSVVCRADGSGAVRTDCDPKCNWLPCGGQCVPVKKTYCVPDDGKLFRTFCDVHMAQDLTVVPCTEELTGSCVFESGRSMFTYTTTDNTIWNVNSGEFICAGQQTRNWRNLNGP